MTSEAHLKVGFRFRLLIRDSLTHVIELKWYREYLFVSPDVYAKRPFS